MVVSMIICVSFFIAFVLMLIQSILQTSTLSDSQLSPLESGFESLTGSTSISASFFLLAALFVMFDVELVLLFPEVLFFQEMMMLTTHQVVYLILVILLTLILEWYWCGLKWSS